MRTRKFTSEIYSPLVAPWQSWIFCFWLSLPKLHYWPPSWIHSITPLSRGIVRTLLSAIYSLLLHFGPFCDSRVSEEMATVNSGPEILEALCQKNVKYWFVLPCTNQNTGLTKSLWYVLFQILADRFATPPVIGVQQICLFDGIFGDFQKKMNLQHV